MLEEAETGVLRGKPGAVSENPCEKAPYHGAGVV